MHDGTIGDGRVLHLYNRGVAKQTLFLDDQDHRHFLETIAYYLDDTVDQRLSTLDDEVKRTIVAGPTASPLVEILAFCLMPNHYHLVVRECVEGGVSTFMRRAMNSYTRAFNTRYDRVGTVFQGRYQFVEVESDEQLLHLVRYVHLNPYVARLIEDLAAYPWSSYGNYRSKLITRLCTPSMVLELAGGSEQFERFTTDYASYGRDLHAIKHLLDPFDLR